MPPIRSRSDVSFAKTTLPYPVFAADFDPYNRGYLVVGGGGGESKSGVPNQITVLDVSDRRRITTAAEVDLSRDEDSVQSVGSLATKDGLLVLAGVNSSAKDQEAGKNEHLRAFDVRYPPRKKQKTEAGNEVEKGQWKHLGKRSLFKPAEGPQKETYQRILRLSPSRQRESGSKRVGAIATGMAKNSEVIVFNATNPVPEEADILTRIELDDRQEAADLDITESEDSVFTIAYCTNDGIHEQTLKYDFSTKRTEKTPKGPRRVYHMPYSNAPESPSSRLKFRCLRFLNAQNVVALCNKSKGGAELRIFHLYPTGPASLIQEMKLPSHVKQAVSMDVCALDADKDGNQQFVIAVAGQDISIEVFTTNYQRQTDTFSKFRSYITIRNVHEHQMTKICFSPFHLRARAQNTKAQSKTGQNGAPAQQQNPQPPPQPVAQYVRLASVSYGNTVVVDTFTLQPFDPDKKDSRYVLSHPSDEAFAKYTYIFVISIIVVVFAFLLQSFLGDFSGKEARGPFAKILPKRVAEFMDKPVAAAYGREVQWVPASEASSGMSGTTFPTGVGQAKGRLQERMDRHSINPSPSSPSPQDTPQPEKEKTLIIRSSPEGMGGVTVDVHPDKENYRAKNSEAKHWDELAEHEKVGWRERLKQAGEWVEGEGEAVLKGVLFSEYAGLVGEAVREGMREL